jgi:hypothetical protein
MTTQLIIRALLSGALIVTVSELAKRNNFTAAIIHSLPLVSLITFIWLYTGTRDTALIARHSESTFWFVLPTMPLFLLLPWLLRHGVGFWPAMAIGAVVTVGLYLLTVQLLGMAGFKF